MWLFLKQDCPVWVKISFIHSTSQWIKNLSAYTDKEHKFWENIKGNIDLSKASKVPTLCQTTMCFSFFYLQRKGVSFVRFMGDMLRIHCISTESFLQITFFFVCVCITFARPFSTILWGWNTWYMNSQMEHASYCMFLPISFPLNE